MASDDVDVALSFQQLLASDIKVGVSLPDRHAFIMSVAEMSAIRNAQIIPRVPELNEDAQKLIYTMSWVAMHMIDVIYAVINLNIGPLLKMSNGKLMPISWAAFITEDDAKWREIVKELTQLGLTNTDYLGLRSAVFHDPKTRTLLPQSDAAYVSMRNRWAESRTEEEIQQLERLSEEISKLADSAFSVLFDIRASGMLTIYGFEHLEGILSALEKFYHLESTSDLQFPFPKMPTYDVSDYPRPHFSGNQTDSSKDVRFLVEQSFKSVYRYAIHVPGFMMLTPGCRQVLIKQACMITMLLDDVFGVATGLISEEETINGLPTVWKTGETYRTEFRTLVDNFKAIGLYEYNVARTTILYFPQVVPKEPELLKLRKEFTKNCLDSLDFNVRKIIFDTYVELQTLARYTMRMMIKNLPINALNAGSCLFLSDLFETTKRATRVPNPLLRPADPLPIDLFLLGIDQAMSQATSVESFVKHMIVTNMNNRYNEYCDGYVGRNADKNVTQELFRYTFCLIHLIDAVWVMRSKELHNIEDWIHLKKNRDVSPQLKDVLLIGETREAHESLASIAEELSSLNVSELNYRHMRTVALYDITEIRNPYVVRARSLAFIQWNFEEPIKSNILTLLGMTEKFRKLVPYVEECMKETTSRVMMCETLEPSTNKSNERFRRCGGGAERDSQRDGRGENECKIMERNVEVIRNYPGIRQLPERERERILATRWLFLHVLDITYTIVENWHGQLRLSCGTEMNFSAMAVLSLSQVTHDTRIIDSAVESLRKMHFDRVDYLGLQANAIFHRCSHFLKTIMPPTSRTEPEIKRLLTIMQLLQSIVPRLFRTLMEWRDGGMIKAAGFEKLDAAVGRYAKEELPHYFDVLLPLVDSIFEMKSLPTIFEAGQFVSNQGLRRFWPFASKCTHFMNLRPENRQFVFAKSWMLLHLADLAHIVTTKTVSDEQELDSGETLFVRNLAFVEGDQGVRMWNTILGYIRKFKPKEFANFRYLMLLKTIEAHDPSDPQIVKAAINAILNSFSASFLDGFAQLLYKQLDALVIYTMRVLLKRREELNAGSLLWEHVESVYMLLTVKKHVSSVIAPFTKGRTRMTMKFIMYSLFRSQDADDFARLFFGLNYSQTFDEVQKLVPTLTADSARLLFKQNYALVHVLDVAMACVLGELSYWYEWFGILRNGKDQANIKDILLIPESLDAFNQFLWIVRDFKAANLTEKDHKHLRLIAAFSSFEEEGILRARATEFIAWNSIKTTKKIDIIAMLGTLDKINKQMRPDIEVFLDENGCLDTTWITEREVDVLLGIAATI
ncbi:unnamed protein product [Caenorhabditis sp. 36 PRJEB53466]|nr:unnamed protein product [Caenorhabditis sp. 36 PRJEB53466]